MDDTKPYLFRTEDFGKTWSPLHSDLPQVGYLHVVREDLVNKNLLYAGSEFGLFLSFDGGQHWMPYKNEFPTIAVRDIQIHPRDMDLLVGTHGRGLWVMDDITPLQKMTAAALESDSALFEPRPVVLYSYKSNSMYSGPYPFQGPNPPEGALITYYLKDKLEPKDEISLTIKDREGQTVMNLQPSKDKGLNRVVWPLREEDPESTERGGTRFRRFSGGPHVLPGEYMVELRLDGIKQSKPLEVKSFAKHDFSLEERNLHQKYVHEIGELARKGNELILSMNQLNEELKSLESRIKEADIKDERLSARLKDIRAKTDKIQKSYSMNVEGRTGYKRPVLVALRGGTLPEQLARLRSSIMGYQGAPTQTQIDQFEDIKKAVNPLLETADILKTKDIPELNALLNELDFPVIKNII
jgi:hypothetical protein